VKLDEIIRSATAPAIGSFKDLIISMIEDCEYEAKYDYKKLPSVSYKAAPVDFMMMLDGRNQTVYNQLFGGGGGTTCKLDINVKPINDGDVDLTFTYIAPRWTDTANKKYGSKAVPLAELSGILKKKKMQEFVHWKLDENDDLAVVRELLEEHVQWKPVKRLSGMFAEKP